MWHTPLGWLLLVAAATAAGPHESRNADASAIVQAEPFDILIRGGTIVDGTGNPWFQGDVAIRGDRIAARRPDRSRRHRAADDRRAGARGRAGVHRYAFAFGHDPV